MSIPDFLCNRPKSVVQHCFKRWEEAENIPVDDIDELGGGNFMVKSQSSSNMAYHISFQGSPCVYHHVPVQIGSYTIFHANTSWLYSGILRLGME